MPILGLLTIFPSNSFGASTLSSDSQGIERTPCQCTQIVSTTMHLISVLGGLGASAAGANKNGSHSFQYEIRTFVEQHALLRMEHS